MTTSILRLPGGLLAALFLSMNAAATPLSAIEGEYDLVSSTTIPDGNWKFTKGRISITKFDERHVTILHACEWKNSPKEVCNERYVAQGRNGNIYLQDMNTSNQRMAFDPASRRLTIVTEGVNGTVRRDVYAATSAPLTDRALVRRMKRERDAVDDLVDQPHFGPYSKWEFGKNPIEVTRLQ